MSSSLHKYPDLDLDALEALASRLAMHLKAGDLVALEGPLGAGKSAFARATVRALLGDSTAEVPSPTFTLVQSYERPNAPDVYHADLYRLADADELYELGLDDARDEAIFLVEWPEKLDDAWAKQALLLTFSLTQKLDAAGENLRHLTLKGDAKWQGRLADMGGQNDG